MTTETKAQHTEGPWVASGSVTPVAEFNLWCGSINGSGEYRGEITSIQSSGNIPGWINNVEAEANAQLIAAAPEMLEALKEFRLHSSLVEIMSASIIERADAIIAKAEGRA